MNVVNVHAIESDLQNNLWVVIKNFHFWIILGILALVSIFYYIDFLTLRDNGGWPWYFRFWEFKNHFNGSLYYLLFFYSVLVFGWKGLALTSLASMLIICPRIVYFNYNITSLSNNIMFLILPPLIGLIIIFWLKWIEREKKTYSEREAERKAFSEEVIRAHEDERKTMAQELHDDTIQTLLATANQTQFLLHKEKTGLTPDLQHHLETIHDSIIDVTEDLRRLCVNLRPSILDDIGLLEALAWLTDNLNSQLIKSRLVIRGEPRKLPSEIDVIVFRFIQEALSNVKRHSEAKEVIVNVDFGAQWVIIKVQDNGKGFIVPEPVTRLLLSKKLGINGMMQRADMVGGKFDIYSVPGEGTLVSLEFKA